MKRRALSIALAAALAVLGIVLILAYVHSANIRAAEKDHPVRVLTAAQPIPEGTKVATALSEGELHAVPYPKGALPPGYLQSGHITRDESIGVFTSALQTGQVIVAQDIGPKSEASSTLVPPPGNYVEMGLPVCQSAAVSGYIGPGSRVVVFDTEGQRNPVQSSCSSHEPPGGGTETTVVATNLEVLSIQGAPPPSSSSGTPVSPSQGESGCSGQGVICVTVAVPTAQALRLADAAATGDLTLVMMTDLTTPPQPGTTYKSNP